MLECSLHPLVICPALCAPCHPQAAATAAEEPLTVSRGSGVLSAALAGGRVLRILLPVMKFGSMLIPTLSPCQVQRPGVGVTPPHQQLLVRVHLQISPQELSSTWTQRKPLSLMPKMAILSCSRSGRVWSPCHLQQRGNSRAIRFWQILWASR